MHAIANCYGITYQIISASKIAYQADAAITTA